MRVRRGKVTVSDVLASFHVTTNPLNFTLSLHDALPIFGIRRRLAPLLENDPDRIRLMNSLLLSMPGSPIVTAAGRSEEHTSELQSQSKLVCRLLLEKKKRSNL